VDLGRSAGDPSARPRRHERDCDRQGLRGQAFAERAGKREIVTSNAAVYLMDTLGTAARSRLVARLAERTTLRLGAKTRVRIDSFVAHKGGELTLGSGAILLDTPASSFGEGLTLDSPFALIAVRGTRFFAGPIDGVFGVFVQRGMVDVSAAGRTVRLERGEGTDIPRRGAPPTPPKRWGKPKIEKALALVR
jgi:ferric-dicitrate binding protein FerR (iron transport regulator)